MTFADIFDEVATWLKDRQIPTTIRKRKPRTLAEVESFADKTGLALPTSFSKFFIEFSDGYEFFWEQKDGDWGLFRMPTLAQLARNQRRWIERIEEAENPDDFADEELAREGMKIWKRMRFWVPFWDEGNGDHFAVDSKSGKIVYDQMGWHGNDERMVNGIPAGRNLADFLTQWSKFCFRRVKSQWWGQFVDKGCITWEAAQFDPQYTRSEAEPDSAATGSQPVRSKTNRTSSAAGSRR